jgi:hypothetical protein
MDIDRIEPPQTIIEMLIENRYGYSFVDVGLTEEDLCEFEKIKIDKNHDYNQFGNQCDWENEIFLFLTEIGENNSDLLEKVAKKIARIANNVMQASCRETAWIALRAGLPTLQYDRPRWHMDAAYYRMEANMLQYKFALTLIGTSTLFYPIPKEYLSMREVIFANMTNRPFMREFCDPIHVVVPKRGEGSYFISGNPREAALHAEPPMKEPRLFFSIVPCNERNIESLRKQVMRFYQRHITVYES